MIHKIDLAANVYFVLRTEGKTDLEAFTEVVGLYAGLLSHHDIGIAVRVGRRRWREYNTPTLQLQACRL